MNPQAKIKLIHNALPMLFDVPNPPPKLALKRPPPMEQNIIVPKISKAKHESSLESEQGKMYGSISYSSRSFRIY